MSLDWDVSKIKDYKNLCYIKVDETTEVVRVNPVTETLIWSAAGCGIRGIAESTVAEFYARIKLQEALFGPLLYTGDGEPLEITVNDLIDHIGLDTNVTPRTRAQFLSQVRDQLDRWKLEAERAIAKAKAADAARAEADDTASALTAQMAGVDAETAHELGF